jgi:hypothetical protein
MSRIVCANCGLEVPHDETKANHCLKALTERMERISKLVGMIVW